MVDMTSVEVLHHRVCLECGCLCDDIEVTLQEGRIESVARACERGQQWFLRPPRSGEPIAAWINGRPAERNDAVARATEILRGARYPLILGLAGVEMEAQRRAIGLADLIGAVIDRAGSNQHSAMDRAIQNVGEVTCSLGEIKSRADVLVYWRADPVTTLPRHFERYALDATGEFLPGGRSNRYLIVVDDRDTPTMARADWGIKLPVGLDFEILWTLRGLVRGAPLSSAVFEKLGLPEARCREFVSRLRQARFGVIFFDDSFAAPPGGQRRVEAMLELTRDLNSETCFSAFALRGGHNIVGAEETLTWQTGFSFGVDMGRGWPRQCGREWLAETVLARRQCDAAVLIGRQPLEGLSDQAVHWLARIPRIHIGDSITGEERVALGTPGTPADEPGRAEVVCFAIGRPGIDHDGTVTRQDGVTLLARSIFGSRE